MKKQFNLYPVNAFGCVFICGKAPKFDKDLETVRGILEKDPETITHEDRIKLIMIYQSSYHKDGKIECVTSYDSSATNCAFCKKMRAAAENNPAHICGMCYDKSQEDYRTEVMNRHTLNMVIMSTVRFSREELALVNIGRLNRVNSSGDIPNQIYAENMVLLAMINKSVPFGFWAKNTSDLIAATDIYGKPENAVYIQSSPIIGKPIKKLAKYFDYSFTVYPDKKTVNEAIKNGASECNGKKCMECGFKCYLKKHNSKNIAELLRGVNKEKRDAIIAWLSENQ